MWHSLGMELHPSSVRAKQTGPENREKVRYTLTFLKCCRAARAAGHPVRYQTDPAWLVNMAINRRAGWPDDPDRFGSAVPVRRFKQGWMISPILQYPPSATAQGEIHPQTIAFINTPRVVVRSRDVPPRYREKLRHRLTWPEDEERF